MICPKCRTKYPEGVTVCPECSVELIGFLGADDAPLDDGAAVQELFEEIVVDENDEYSPIVYKVADTKNAKSAEKHSRKEAEAENEDEDSYHSGSPIAVFMFVMAILFLCAGGVMFFLGKKAETQQTLELINRIIFNLIG